MQDPDTLLAEWNLRRRRASEHAAGIRTYLAVLAVGSFGTVALALVQALQGDGLLSLVVVSANAALLAWAIWGIVIKPRRRVEQLAAQLALPDKSLQAQLGDLLAPVLVRLGLIGSVVHTRLALRQFSASPTVASHHDAIHLFLPLGFFRLLSTDRDAARAIVAHELAHCAQKDSSEWLRASAFSSFARSALLPFIAIQAVAVCLVIIRIEEGRQTENSSLAYESAVMRRHVPSYISHQLDPRAITLEKLGVSLRAVFAFGMIVALAAHVRKMRRNSEQMADLAAAAVAGPDAVARALTSTQRPSGPREIFDTHPDLGERLEALNRAPTPDYPRWKSWDANPFRSRPGAVFVLLLAGSVATILVQAGYSMSALERESQRTGIDRSLSKWDNDKAEALRVVQSEISPYLLQALPAPAVSMDSQVAAARADSAASSNFWTAYKETCATLRNSLNQAWVAGEDSALTNNMIGAMLQKADRLAALESAFMHVRVEILSFLKLRSGAYTQDGDVIAFKSEVDQRDYHALRAKLEHLGERGKDLASELSSFSENVVDSLLDLPDR
jgi:hypothetical protein